MRDSFWKIRDIPRLNGNPPAQKKHFPPPSRTNHNFLRNGIGIRGTLLPRLQRQNMHAFRLKAVPWPRNQPRVNSMRLDDYPLIEIPDRSVSTNMAVSKILRLMLGIRHLLLVEPPTQSVESQEQVAIDPSSIPKTSKNICARRLPNVLSYRTFSPTLNPCFSLYARIFFIPPASGGSI